MCIRDSRAPAALRRHHRQRRRLLREVVERSRRRLPADVGGAWGPRDFNLLLIGRLAACDRFRRPDGQAVAHCLGRVRPDLGRP
eukprot:11115278-Alexandrium_andersonii.AAC.1